MLAGCPEQVKNLAGQTIICTLARKFVKQYALVGCQQLVG